MEVGCAVGMTIKENMFADKVDRYLKGRIFLNGKVMNEKAEQWVDDFNILCTSAEQTVSMLSGGNMQNVVAARELTENVEIIIA